MTEEQKAKNEISKTVAIGALSLGIVGLGLGFLIGKGYANNKEDIKWLSIFRDSLINGPTVVTYDTPSSMCAVKFLVKVVDVIDK